MNHKPRLVLHILTQLILVCTLVSCTSGVKPTLDSSVNQISPAVAEATQLPSATPTVEPTKTSTAVPTESQAQIASKFELNQARTYEVRTEGNETCLIDTYNQACMAVLDENQTWTALDETDPIQAEQMYGHLIPEEGNFSGIGEPIEISVGRFRHSDVNMYYTGNMVEQAIEGGRVIQVMKSVIRDAAGVHVVNLVADVHGEGILDHNFPFNFCFEGDEGSVSWLLQERDDVMKVIKPGQRLLVQLIFPISKLGTTVVVPPSELTNPGYPMTNNQAKITFSELYNLDQDNHFTSAELEGLLKGTWPDREITLYSVGYNKIVLSNKADLDYFRPQN